MVDMSLSTLLLMTQSQLTFQKTLNNDTFNIILQKSCQCDSVLIPVASNTDHLRKTMHYRDN